VLAVVVLVGALLALSGVARPQPASAATPTVQVVAADTLSPASATTGPGLGEAIAGCPMGTTAVGGGADTSGATLMAITSDGPEFAGLSLRADGGGRIPNAWEATALNFSNKSQALWVTAICAPSSGGNIAPIEVDVVTARAGTTDVSASANCSPGQVAIGGGVDTGSHSKEVIGDSAPAGSTTPTGWAADVRGGIFFVGVDLR
jgi:hypothetical protein